MHNAHHYSHHDKRWLTSHDESKNSDHRTPESSNKDSESSTSSKSSSKSSKCKHENYHIDTGKIPQKKRKVSAAMRSAQRQKEVRNKKPFNPKMLLQGEFEGKDIPMGSEQDPHDVTNLFKFNN